MDNHDYDYHDYDFMDEIIDRVRRETIMEYTLEFAKKLLTKSKLTIEDIADICKLPLEKVQELAADMSIGESK